MAAIGAVFGFLRPALRLATLVLAVVAAGVLSPLIDGLQSGGKNLRGMATLVFRGGEQHTRLSDLTALNRSVADGPAFATNQLRLRKADKDITDGPVTLRVVFTDQAGNILAIDVNGLVAKAP